MDAQRRQKQLVILIIVVLIGILFVQLVNLLGKQNPSTKSRAAEIPGTGILPTSSVSLSVAACGKKQLNCNALKPFSTQDTEKAKLIPPDKTGDTTLMYCVLTTDKQDALCGYKAKGNPSCPTAGGVARVQLATNAGAPDTSLHCMYVHPVTLKNGISDICPIVELQEKGSGLIPVSDDACKLLTITPTVSLPIQVQ